MPLVTVVKVGAARRIPQSRVWIEGRRLIDAGFAHGTRYNVEWHDAGATLIPDTAGARKVAGAVDRPIIDITGERVRSLQCDSATVTFSAKKITIEGIK